MKTIDIRKLATGKPHYFELDMVDLQKQPWFVAWMGGNFGSNYLSYYGKAPDSLEAVIVTSPGLSGATIINFDGAQKWINSGNRISLYGYAPTSYDQFLRPKEAFVRAREIEPTFHQLLSAHPVSGVATSGWDPEIFVVDEKENLLPAFDFLPAKSKPIKTKDMYACDGRAGNVYYDGFQAEFTTFVGSCHGYGIDYLRAGLKEVLHAARLKTPKAKLSIRNVFHIPQNVLLSATDEQVGLGCLPSQNVYGRDPFIVEDPRSLPVRVAGGHIHFGLSNPLNGSKIKDVTSHIKALDRIVGLMSVAIFDEVDDPMRREFYGRAGEYRQPNYGYEYRVLSNAWLGDPHVAHIIMETARSANRLVGITDEQVGWKLTDDKVQEIINYCDVKSARKILKKHWDVWEKIVGARFCLLPNAMISLKEIVFGGVHAGFPDFNNIEQNWMLTSGDWKRHSDDSRKTWAGHSAQERYLTLCKSATSAPAPSVLTVGR